MLTLSSHTLPPLPVQYATTNINHQTDRTIRLMPDVDVEVEFDKWNISYTTIGTTALSSCRFILVTGHVDQVPFVYLWHTPLTNGDDTPTALLMLNFILERISNDIFRFISSKPPPSQTMKQQLTPQQITNLKVLTGGSIKINHDLVRDAFIILNDQNVNVETERMSPWAKYFYDSLKNKVTILAPVTFLVSNDSDEDDDDKDEEFAGASISSESSLFVKYSCFSNQANLCIEWVGDGCETIMASMLVDLGKIGAQQLTWTLQTDNILLMQKDLQFNKEILNDFNKALDYVLSVIDEKEDNKQHRNIDTRDRTDNVDQYATGNIRDGQESSSRIGWDDDDSDEQRTQWKHSTLNDSYNRQDYKKHGDTDYNNRKYIDNRLPKPSFRKSKREDFDQHYRRNWKEEQKHIDGEWYNNEDVFDDELNPLINISEERKKKRISTQQRPINQDIEKWKKNRMIQSDVVSKLNYGQDFDDDSKSRVHLLLTNVVPPFLDGQLEFIRQFEPVIPVKDLTSYMTIIGRKCCQSVQKYREQKERRLAQEKFELDGAKLGNILGIKCHDQKDDQSEDIDYKKSQKFAEHMQEKTDAISDFARKRTIDEQRKFLPIYAIRDDLLKIIRENNIIICVGETGSGKTTQMTQNFVLD
ncbi:unnamed protein product [Rotaria sordida]|uniref:Uncharacterized protein n=2 Tax=Rotaria sordida TaxID=392033 RepID=A0A815QMT7_9BILA|nr:unnamed protein product [Rotaria sordida]